MIHKDIKNSISLQNNKAKISFSYHMFIVLLNLFLIIRFNSFGNLIFIIVYTFLWFVLPVYVKLKKIGNQFSLYEWRLTPFEKKCYQGANMGHIIAFDTEARKKIRKIIEFSFQNIIQLSELRREGKLKKNEALPLPGDKENHTIMVPEGYKVVYSIENQGDGENQLGLCKHISMSTDVPGELPHPLAIQMAMLEFGFENKLYETFFWPEEFGGDTQIAINVIEPINGWPKEMQPDIKEKNMQIFSSQAITDIDSLCKQALESKT